MASWQELTGGGGITDHGGLTGLTDDDHTIYTLADGTRAFTGTVGGITPAADADLVIKSYVDNAIGFEFDYYFSNTASDIGGIYYAMTDNDLLGGESSLTTAALGAADDQALVNFATLSGEPGVQQLNSGIYDLHFHVEKTVGTKPVTVYAALYKYDGTIGATDPIVETLLGTSEVSAAITAKVELDLHMVISSPVTILVTDRLVLKFFANVGATGSDATVVIYQEGTTDSHFTFGTESAILSNIFVRQDDTNWADLTDGGATTLHSHAGGGADTALSNLASVAINTSLISDTDSTDDLGSSAVRWANTYSDSYWAGATEIVSAGPGGANLNINTSRSDGNDTQVTITNVGSSGYARLFIGGSGFLTYDNVDSLYLKTATVNRKIYIQPYTSGVAGGFNIKAHTIPNADSTYRLGDSTYYFLETYTDKLILNSTATLDGSVAGKVNIVGDITVNKSTPLLWLGDTGTDQDYAATIRLTEDTTTYKGGYIMFDGASNLLTIGVHNAADTAQGSDLDIISFRRVDGSAFMNVTSTDIAMLINQKSTGDIVDFQDNGTSVLKVADGSKIGFFNTAAAVRTTGWSATNVSSDKIFDANATTIDELADVLGTLINDLKTYGLLGA